MITADPSVVSTGGYVALAEPNFLYGRILGKPKKRFFTAGNLNVFAVLKTALLRHLSNKIRMFYKNSLISEARSFN